MTRRLGNLRQHFWKTIRMSKTLGVDLSESMAVGQLSHADYARIVQRCRGCNWADGCESWMTRQTGPQPEVPAQCANADSFDALRQAKA
ncbi:MAG: DUF6455 family protein [Brevirhabdus sp.]